MHNDISDPIGGAWLAQLSGVTTLAPLYVISSIGGRRETVYRDHIRYETYQENMRPAHHPAAHLQFHLRHEVIHFELLAQVFQNLGGAFIQEWVNTEPTGQYARRAAFLYEWLNGEVLKVPNNLGGNYADALSDKRQVTTSPQAIVKNTRWRINDNIAGTPHFYPLLVKTEAFERAQNVDITQMLSELSDEFGEDLLMRSAVWMTLRESKASFAIEGESNQLKRIERFADVMAKRTGQGDSPLNSEALAQLQHEILGDQSLVQHYGLRQSPIFVGQTLQGLKERVYYIAPPSDGLADKLHGLKIFLDKTVGQSALMRSAVAAFGFVYIHPLADGNGRVHRFLINDILRRDQVVMESLILPISQVIAEHPSERNAYNKVLDKISTPLMARLQNHYRFATERTLYPDGIRSNLILDDTSELEYQWRFWDFTPHVLYLSDLITHVIKHEMHQESIYLKQHDAAREAIKEIAEMPNDYADRIIRSILQTQGQKTHKLLKEIPLLEDDLIWQDMVSAVRRVFEL